MKRLVFTNLLTRRIMSTLSQKPIENSICTKLTGKFQPQHLEVINESSKHNVPKGSETHFKVVVISDNFEGMPLIKRHRLVNEVLKEELENGVHALSIVAKTQVQWEESGQHVSKSPPCRGAQACDCDSVLLSSSLLKVKNMYSGVNSQKSSLIS